MRNIKKMYFYQIVLIFLALLLSLPLFFIPQAAQGAKITIPNPIKASPANQADSTIIDIVFAGLAGFAAIFAVLAFGFLIFSAFKLIIARDNEEAITKAKQGVWWSIWAFVVAILAFSMVSAVFQILGGEPRDELKNPDVLAPPIQDAGFLGVFQRIIVGILGLSTVAAILMIVYAGIKMVWSSGDEEAVTHSKTIIRWAIVGIIIIVLSFSILKGVSLIFQ